MAETLTVMQLNCRSVRKHKLQIQYIAEKENADVICLNETKSIQLPRLQNHTLASCIKNSNLGSAIYIKKGINYKQIDTITKVNSEGKTETELIRINVLGIEITCLYASPSHDNLEEKEITTNADLALIVGDLNTIHPLINSKNDRWNNNGKIVCNKMYNGELVLLNEHEPTHKDGNTLDLHLASRKLTALHKEFRINKQTPSDHYSTISEFYYKKPKPTYLKLNWKKFRENLEKQTETLTHINSPKQLELKVNEITNKIQESHQPALYESKHPTTNRTIRRLVSQKHSLEKQANKLKRIGNKNTQEFAEIQRLLNKTRREIKKEAKKAETDHQMRLIDNATDPATGSKFWKAIKRLLNDKTTSNQLPHSNQEAANAFAEKLKSTMTTNKAASNKDKKHEEEITRKIGNIDFNFEYLSSEDRENTNVDPQRLKRLLKNRKNTAPGEDGINYNLIKRLPENTFKTICHLIESSIKLGHVPENWKSSIVTMIPKPGKDHKNIKGYRPLSLTACLGKLCECVVNEELVAHCESKNIFKDQQSAYRKGRCTTDNLLCLTEIGAKALHKNNSIALALLDVEQAFDSVWHDGIIEKQIQYRVPWWIIKWTKSFLTNRKVTVIYNQAKSNTFTPTAGVPQGSIISPILFNMYVSQPDCHDSHMSQYADDMGPYAQGRTQKIATRKLQKGINKLTKWCDKWKILLNASKTTFMLITKDKKDETVHLKLKKENIKPSDTATFLGLTLDKKLKWDKHVKEIKRKMQNRINKLYHLKSKGIRPKVLLHLYKSLIRPLCTYANAAWANVSKKYIESLQIEQNRAIRIALNLPRWTRITELHEKAQLPMLEDYINKLNSNYLKKAINNNEKIKEMVNQCNVYGMSETPIRAIKIKNNWFETDNETQ